MVGGRLCDQIERDTREIAMPAQTGRSRETVAGSRCRYTVPSAAMYAPNWYLERHKPAMMPCDCAATDLIDYAKSGRPQLARRMNKFWTQGWLRNDMQQTSSEASLTKPHLPNYDVLKTQSHR